MMHILGHETGTLGDIIASSYHTKSAALVFLAFKDSLGPAPSFLSWIMGLFSSEHNFSLRGRISSIAEPWLPFYLPRNLAVLFPFFPICHYGLREISRRREAREEKKLNAHPHSEFPSPISTGFRPRGERTCMLYSLSFTICLLFVSYSITSFFYFSLSLASWSNNGGGTLDSFIDSQLRRPLVRRYGFFTAPPDIMFAQI